MLEQKRVAGAYDRLVIAAAPAALGDLRPALSEGVRQTIMAELPKDLTSIPTLRLSQHLDGVIALEVLANLTDARMGSASASRRATSGLKLRNNSWAEPKPSAD